MRKETKIELGVAALFLLLSLLFFIPQTLGGKTMLPADNLFAFPPWDAYAQEAGVSIPHNDLLSDLILENYIWKRFFLDSIKAREVPLWNPYIVGGMPFLAGGQHSMLYPLSILFYILPLEHAYGWYALLHTALAGYLMYWFLRTLGTGRLGAIVAGATYMFSGFMFVHNVFPMIMGATVWLPAILLIVERIVQCAGEGSLNLQKSLPLIILGTLAVTMVMLAGHPEMYYYVGLVTLFYAFYRLVRLWISSRSLRAPLRAIGVLAAIALLGVIIGAVQWVPLLELVRHNFREGSASFEEVRGWAWPWRQVFAMFMPDIYGNPTHHTYFNLFTMQVTPITKNLNGAAINNPNWGMKNYVEAAGYLGILPTMLALIGILRRKGRHIGFFVVLAVFSIMFVFGSPLYILIYKLPGLSQVHSPFRWIFPYTLCMSVLAGFGAESFWGAIETRKKQFLGMVDRFAQYWVPGLLLAGGLIGIAALGVTFIYKEQLMQRVAELINDLARANEAMDGPQMFYSFLFQNFFQLGIFMIMAAVALLVRKRIKNPMVWLSVVLLVGVGEAYYYQHDFFTATDPNLIVYKTPLIEFLEQDTETYRITSHDASGPPVMIANSAWFYNIQDMRGYDSIIPKNYVQYMERIEPQHALLYNRIGGIRGIDSLSSSLLDLANVKYVLTDPTVKISNRNYKLVYDGEARVYLNENYLPRAFLSPRGRYIPEPMKFNQAMRNIVPYEEVLLDHEPPSELAADRPIPEGFNNTVSALRYTPNEVEITFRATSDAYLVLTDTYFDGWKAFIRPVDAADPRLEERELGIEQAYGAFRAVQVPEGEWVVRFKYTPNSVKYGLFVSFIGGVILLLMIGYWGVRRFFRRPQDDGSAQRVTRNTVAPIALNLVNKLIDMVFAMLMLRILGPADAGQYYLAVVVISWFDIFTNFGLNTFLVRDVARDKANSSKYLANTIILRMLLCVVSVPLLTAFVLIRRLSAPLEASTVLAIALFGLALIPSNISASISAIFMAHERMELPALVTTVTTIVRVVLGAIALLMATSFIGLAVVSIITNLITLLIFVLLLRQLALKPRLEWDPAFQRAMLAESFPLMLNNLLATLFFKVAVILLEWMVPDIRVVGWYSTAYKYIDAVGIVPAFFTMAIFPLMSRYAAESKDSLYRAYILSIKLLLTVAFPGALLGWAFASPLITILGGSQYQPYATSILRIMVWYMPMGFINSVTQYVLIALGQQRYLTLAFTIGLVFNIIANLVLIRRIGYMASAYITVVSELVLLIPFYIGIRRYLRPINWLALVWKSVLAALPLAVLLALSSGVWRLAALLVGAVAYIVLMQLLHVFDAQEEQVIERVIPLSRLCSRLARLLPFAA
ncbi:MAG: oligosaccharide flippase family protein [Chloroflexi bacterium]|nr:oligosaccharide flippase family protein [Chloroflexota bacterium]